jgi:hypothetical protein
MPYNQGSPTAIYEKYKPLILSRREIGPDDELIEQEVLEEEGLVAQSNSDPGKFRGGPADRVIDSVRE